MTGDVVRSWLSEGRITPDSLIWRDGWGDWKEAIEVLPQGAFPQLRIADGVPGLDRLPETAGPGLGVPVGGGHAASGRRSVWSQGLLIVILGALGVVALAAVYLWARYF